MITNVVVCIYSCDLQFSFFSFPYYFFPFFFLEKRSCGCIKRRNRLNKVIEKKNVEKKKKEKEERKALQGIKKRNGKGKGLIACIYKGFPKGKIETGKSKSGEKGIVKAR